MVMVMGDDGASRNSAAARRMSTIARPLTLPHHRRHWCARFPILSSANAARAAGMSRRPWRIFRGHPRSIVSVSVCSALRLCLSASSSVALVHDFEGDGVLRRFLPVLHRRPPHASTPSSTAASPSPKLSDQALYEFKACVLSELGYVALHLRVASRPPEPAGPGAAGGGGGGCQAQDEQDVIQIYTVNGVFVTERSIRGRIRSVRSCGGT